MNNNIQFNPLGFYYKGLPVQLSDAAFVERAALEQSIKQKLGYQWNAPYKIRIYLDPFDRIVLEVWDQSRGCIQRFNPGEIPEDIRNDARQMLTILEQSHFNKYHTVTQFSIPRTSQPRPVPSPSSPSGSRTASPTPAATPRDEDGRGAVPAEEDAGPPPDSARSASSANTFYSYDAPADDAIPPQAAPSPVPTQASDDASNDDEDQPALFSLPPSPRSDQELLNALEAADSRAENFRVFSQQMADCNLALRTKLNELQRYYEQELSRLIWERDSLLAELNGRPSVRDIELLEAQLTEKDAAIEALRDTVSDLERQLEQLNQELLAKNEEIQDFSESLNHAAPTSPRSFADAATQIDEFAPPLFTSIPIVEHSRSATPTSADSDDWDDDEADPEIRILSSQFTALQEQLISADAAAAVHRQTEFDLEEIRQAYDDLKNAQLTLTVRYFQLMVRSFQFQKYMQSQHQADQQTIAELHASNALLQEQLNQTKEALRQVQAARNALASASDGLDTENQRLNALLEEVTQASLKDSNHFEQNLSDLVSLLQRQRTRYEALLDEAEDQVRFLVARLDKLMAELGARDALTPNFAGMEQFLIDTADAVAQEPDAEEVLASVLPEDLLKYLQTLQDANRDLSIAEAEALSQNRQLLLYNAILRTLLRQRTTQKDALAAQMEQTHLEFERSKAAFEDTLQKLSARATITQTEKERLAREMEQLRAEMAAAQAAFDQRLSELQDQLAQAEANSTRLKDLNAALESRLQETQAKLQQFETIRGSLTVTSSIVVIKPDEPALSESGTTVLSVGDPIVAQIPNLEDMEEFLLESAEAANIDPAAPDDFVADIIPKRIQDYIVAIEEMNAELMKRLEISRMQLLKTKFHQKLTQIRIRKKLERAQALFATIKGSLAYKSALAETLRAEISSLCEEIEQLRAAYDQMLITKNQELDDLRAELIAVRIEMNAENDSLRRRLGKTTRLLSEANGRLFDLTHREIDQDAADRAFFLDLHRLRYDPEKRPVHPLVSPRGDSLAPLILPPRAADADPVNYSDFLSGTSLAMLHDGDSQFIPMPVPFDDRPDQRIEELERQIAQSARERDLWLQEQADFVRMLRGAQDRIDELERQNKALQERNSLIEASAESLQERLHKKSRELQQRPASVSIAIQTEEEEDEDDVSTPTAAKPPQGFVSKDVYETLKQQMAQSELAIADKLLPTAEFFDPTLKIRLQKGEVTPADILESASVGIRQMRIQAAQQSEVHATNLSEAQDKIAELESRLAEEEAQSQQYIAVLSRTDVQQFIRDSLSRAQSTQEAS